MNAKPLKILQIVGEIYPYSKTGGLGHVTADITYNLANAGHEVTVFTPLYGSVWKVIKKKQVENILIDFPVQVDSDTTITCSCVKYVKQNGTAKPITFYFINHYEFFGRYSRNLYLSSDMHKRFYYFSKATAAVIKELNLNFDVVHAHDWMTGLFPRIFKESMSIKSKIPKTMYTIHNLAFQGSGFMNDHRFDKKYQRPATNILPKYWDDTKWERINFLKQGIKSADMITTVSDTYAQEIMTPELGEGLSNFLQKRRPIYGITNGIDYKEYNTQTSKKIFHNFNANNFYIEKRKNKEKLYKTLGIPSSLVKYPLVITTHRLSYQKGFNLILDSFRRIIKMNIVLLVMGDGDKWYLEKFTELEKKKIKNFRLITPFTEILNERLMAAGDILLSPSVYEPCGTAHMKGMRYGVVPVARKIGGLADTISNYDHKRRSGTGFVFLNNDKDELVDSLKKALRLYENKIEWRKLVKRCMSQSFSWERSIEEYTYLYNKLINKPKKKKR